MNIFQELSLVFAGMAIVALLAAGYIWLHGQAVKAGKRHRDRDRAKSWHDESSPIESR